MQIFIQNGSTNIGSNIPAFTTLYASVHSSPIYSPELTTSSPVSSSHSLTSICISRFLTNLQEANLRFVKVDSNNPAYISSHSQNTLPSFVAAPGTAGTTVKQSTQPIQDGMLENGEEGGVNDMEDDTLGTETSSLEVKV